MRYHAFDLTTTVKSGAQEVSTYMGLIMVPCERGASSLADYPTDELLAEIRQRANQSQDGK